MDAISAISGLTVNYYALIDLKGFQNLINAVGGITVDVKARVPIGGETTKISGYVNPGVRKLTGYQALWYARSRTGTSDYDRMARQRCVMTSMLDQLNPETVLLKFNGIASASSKVISTSIPEGDLGTFVDLALKAKAQKVTSVQFVPPVIVPAHPDFAHVRALVAGAIAAAEAPARDLDGECIPLQLEQHPQLGEQHDRRQLPRRGRRQGRLRPGVTETGPDGRPAAGSGPPQVSVVMPILNEERHLAEAVKAAFDQEYDGSIEVVLALGPSSDGTDEIATGLAAGDPRIVLVPNPSGRTADGLNAAIAASGGPVVVRVDGHGLLEPDYVRTAVSTLAATGAANVGGLMAAEGTTPFERAVAAAMTSVLGVGAARFHTGGEPGPADTVYLGVFRREWLDRVGGYDPQFVRAQDWEMNHRIRAAGGLVYFTPALRVRYRPRGHPEGAGPAVLRVRPVAPGRLPGASRHGQRALPGRPGRGGRGRRGHGPGRAGHAVGAGAAGGLPGAGRRRVGGDRIRSVAGGARPAAARPGDHAHVVGRRLPDQPVLARAGRAPDDDGGQRPSVRSSHCDRESSSRAAAINRSSAWVIFRLRSEPSTTRTATWGR